jgi:nucleotide-binding universal stress UspA family protein
MTTGTITRILVPLDLHRLSEAKLPVAEAQARAFGAELILLHVCAPERSWGTSVSPAEAQARTYLDAITARLHAEGIAARALVRWGSPAATICAEIVAQQAELVVLGSPVRHGLARWGIGSVATAVIGTATCPVLLVHTAGGPIEQPPAVRSFAEDAARAGLVAPFTLGLRTVDIARIVGSVGRATDLDAQFRSRHRRREDDRRLARIRRLMEEGAALPPIELYKLGYGYYVLDGNHRVAAAKSIGQLEIEALVTEFVPLGDAQAHRVAAERRAFERATGLRRIGAALTGHYPRLEEMVRTYAAQQGRDDLHEAARLWETAVYQPVAAKIRALRLTERFPGERTADVFVHVAICREADMDADGASLTWDEAIARQQR